MSKGFASNYRIVLLATLVLVCFGAIGTRLVFLHVLDRAKYLSFIGKARRQVSIEKGRRGDIVDTRGDLLATSISTVTIAVDPQVLREKDEAKWPELARLLNLPYPELRHICTTKYREKTIPSPLAIPAPASASPSPEEEDDIDEKDGKRLIRWAKLAENISESTYDQIQKLGIKGIIGQRAYVRTYPHNQLAAHLIGFVNKEGTPSTGIEAYTNPFLFAADGWRESEKDGRQRELAQFRSREISATNGYTVKLSIDSVIQNWAEEELADLAKKFSPKRAVIIVSDAKTGFLLALANYPTFNLNDYNKAPMDIMKNYAITDQIEPGSTFKIVAASAALNEKAVTPETRFDCTNEIVEYQGRKLRLMNDAPHHWEHPLSVAEIISHSSNPGAAQIAMRLGETKYFEYVKKFGFGSRTGFPFGGEINGVVKDYTDTKTWSPTDFTRIPAGYSISATPMQIHYAMGVIASGGELLVPQIISKVYDTNGNLVFEFQKQARRRVISPETAQTMRNLLQSVVSIEGTAAKIFLPGYQLAGKTGTAQKIIDGRYSKTNHVGSFVGFFPAPNPRVVVSVIVDDATTFEGRAAYGATVAAPSFKHIAEKLIPYLDIKPTPDAAPALQRPGSLIARQP